MRTAPIAENRGISTRATKWLDEIGSPVLRFAYPEALTNIITEEIGTYLGGARSAEDTAKMLQSRVSLYLAEQN